MMVFLVFYSIGSVLAIGIPLAVMGFVVAIRFGKRRQ